MKKIVKCLAIGCMTSMILSSCGIKNVELPPASSTEIQIPSVVEPPPEESNFTFFAPLTGEGGEEEFGHRPIAVLINNLAPARPQSGLTSADILWEVLAEGGITRLIAIFQSTKDAELDIGPIRSNRPYLIDIADSYGAIIAHAGASNAAYAILQKQGKPYLDEISNAGSYYWRSKERKAPHNLYSNLSQLRLGAEKKKYESISTLTGYIFNKEAVSSSIGEIKNVKITFQLKGYRVSYQFDEETKTYKRFINEEAHVDKNNDQQLFTNNIVVMQTEHKVLDNEGRLAVDLQKGGQALLISEGKLTEGQWVRAADGMIRFIHDGEEMKLTAGKTIIHIVPTGKAITEHVVWE